MSAAVITGSPRPPPSPTPPPPDLDSLNPDSLSMCPSHSLRSADSGDGCYRTTRNGAESHPEEQEEVSAVRNNVIPTQELLSQRTNKLRDKPDMSELSQEPDGLPRDFAQDLESLQPNNCSKITDNTIDLSETPLKKVPNETINGKTHDNLTKLNCQHVDTHNNSSQHVNRASQDSLDIFDSSSHTSLGPDSWDNSYFQVNPRRHSFDSYASGSLIPPSTLDEGPPFEMCSPDLEMSSAPDSQLESSTALNTGSESKDNRLLNTSVNAINHMVAVVGKPPLDNKTAGTAAVVGHKHKSTGIVGASTYISGGKLRLKSGSVKHVRWKERDNGEDCRVADVVTAADDKENAQQVARSTKETIREFRRRMKQRIAQDRRVFSAEFSDSSVPNSARDSSDTRNNMAATAASGVGYTSAGRHQSEYWRRFRERKARMGASSQPDLQAWASARAVPNTSAILDRYEVLSKSLSHSDSTESFEDKMARTRLGAQDNQVRNSKSFDDLYDSTRGKDTLDAEQTLNNRLNGIHTENSMLKSKSTSDFRLTSVNNVKGSTPLHVDHEVSNSARESEVFYHSPDALSRSRRVIERSRRVQSSSSPTTLSDVASMLDPGTSQQRQGRRRSVSDLGFKTKEMLHTPRTLALLRNPAFRKHIAKTLDMDNESSESEVKNTMEKRFLALKTGAHTARLTRSYSGETEEMPKPAAQPHKPLKLCHSDTHLVKQMQQYAKVLAKNDNHKRADSTENIHEESSVKNVSPRTETPRLQIPSYHQFRSQRLGLTRSLSSSVEALVPAVIHEEGDAETVKKAVTRPLSASYAESNPSRRDTQNSSPKLMSDNWQNHPVSSAITSNLQTTQNIGTRSETNLAVEPIPSMVDSPQRAWHKRSQSAKKSEEVSSLRDSDVKTVLSKSKSVEGFSESRLRGDHRGLLRSATVPETLELAGDRIVPNIIITNSSETESQGILTAPKRPKRRAKKNQELGNAANNKENTEQTKEEKRNRRRNNSRGDDEEVIIDCTKSPEARFKGHLLTTEEGGGIIRSLSDVSDKVAEERRTRAAKERKNKPYKSDPFHMGSKSKTRPQQPDIAEESREDIVAFLQESHADSEVSLDSFLTDTASQKTITDLLAANYVHRLCRDQLVANGECRGCKGKLRFPRFKRSEAQEAGKQSSGAEVERVDSGVGRETSAGHGPTTQGTTCEDCEETLSSQDADTGLFLCVKCEKRRGERKDIIQEIINSEANYGQDLKIIHEEFYSPMKSGNLLNADHTDTIFLNLEELMSINESFSEQLQDALDLANEQGDEDYQTVHIGKLFIEATNMLLAFENYCINQSAAPVLLDQLEREKDLLRIFLQVSQNDNSVLRRMDLKSFLMIPVQRIMRYPLLLERLHKLTSTQHEDRERIQRAKHKIEDILEHINFKTKGTTSVRLKKKDAAALLKHAASFENIELNRVAMETLAWNRNESDVVISGRVFYTHTADLLTTTRRGGKGPKFQPLYAVLVTQGKGPSFGDPLEEAILRTDKIKQCALVLVREKGGKYTAFKDPIFLTGSQAAMDPDVPEVFEIIEIAKDNFFLKADSENETLLWFNHIKFQMNKLGKWRQRRNALPNIMISTMK